MHSELVYQLALCEVPGIGSVHAKKLYEIFGTATAIFSTHRSELERIEHIGGIKARNIKSFKDFSKAEREIAFMNRYNITPMSLVDKNYPQRLLNCFDPPAMLFFIGNANLNSSRIVSVIGTRNNSEYGRQFTDRLIKSLASKNVLVVSGLAFGIDAIAHKSSLKYGIPTVAVVGHGLDMIYPKENTQLAKEAIESGGVLTELRSRTKPDKHNFPNRNRIVAGISDATIVIESGLKGGSIITANMAWDYNRDVFAVPGRTTDTRSAGCNRLIKENKAMILTDPEELIEQMGWQEHEKKHGTLQKKLFHDLSADELQILEYLKKKESTGIEELIFSSGASASTIATALLKFEMSGVVKALPGKRFSVEQ